MLRALDRSETCPRLHPYHPDPRHCWTKTKASGRLFHHNGLGNANAHEWLRRCQRPPKTRGRDNYQPTRRPVSRAKLYARLRDRAKQKHNALTPSESEGSSIHSTPAHHTISPPRYHIAFETHTQRSPINMTQIVTDDDHFEKQAVGRAAQDGHQIQTPPLTYATVASKSTNGSGQSGCLVVRPPLPTHVPFQMQPDTPHIPTVVNPPQLHSLDRTYTE